MRDEVGGMKGEGERAVLPKPAEGFRSCAGGLRSGHPKERQYL